jgi:hypothetical protein
VLSDEDFDRVHAGHCCLRDCARGVEPLTFPDVSGDDFERLAALFARQTP